MRASQLIPADLVTPLGAYLALRGEGGGSFLLESVERGRLGRNSFVGRGARVVSFEEAEALGAPVVGYLAYDHASTLEPTVPRPADGPDLPESRFVVVETLVRFDHGAGVAEVLVGDVDEVAARLAAPVEIPQRPRPSVQGELVRAPTRERYVETVRRCKEHIR
jgi:anthranilate synthase component 1